MLDDAQTNQRSWGVMSQTGQAFFSSLVEHLATTLELKAAFIVESMDLKGERVDPLASWGVQGFRGEQAYDTRGTPCERVDNGASCVYVDNLPDYFPDDVWLQQSGMQSYAAIPLLNEDTHVLGYIGVLDDREMENPDDAIALLESFAHRTTEEIVRKRADTGLRRIPGESSSFIPDQTKQEQVIERLHESEQHFRALFDNSSCGLLFTDPETGEFLECNRRICEMLGYSREDLIRLSVPDIHREKDLPWVMNEFRELVNNEKSQSLNVPVKRKDGSLLYVNIASFWIKHQGKQCLVGAFLDITGNRKIEQALRLEKEKLSCYLENSPAITLVLDECGTVLLINRAGCEVLGSQVHDIVGKNWFDQFLPPRLHEKNRRMLDKMIAGFLEPFEFVENPIINAQGEERVIAWHNSVLRNKQGRVIATLSAGEDITDKQKTELALKKEKARLAYAQKISHVGSWELDLESGKERWSDEVFRIFGYAPQAFTPSESRKLESVHPDDRTQFQSQLRRGVATREEFEFEFRVQRSNNEVRIVRALNEVVRNRKGEAVSLLGTLQDVTQRRQADAQLKRSHEELRRLADHLQSARESERISIAREIHDEMAQSLTAQKIDIVRLKSRLPQDEPFLTELSGEILQSINQTINSVQRILTELRPALLDDLGLIAAIEWQVTEFQRRTKVQCHLVLPDDEPLLTPEQRTALFRIMQESLSNILRHSNADEVWVELTVDGSWLSMSIIDNGKGISDLEVSGSCSFGLMGMRERAHIFGGSVNIHGREGEGTTVSAKIPLKSKRGKVN